MMNLQTEHQESWINRVNSTWGFGLAVSMGMEDSVNINTLSLTLLFFFFLVYIVRTRKNVVLCGIVCMALELMVLSSLIHGKFDFILSREPVYLYVKIFCALLGLILIFVGLIYFRDWWQLRFRNNILKPWIKLPVYLAKKDVSEKIFIVRFLVSMLYWVISAVFGVTIIFLSSYAIQDYAMFILLLDSITKDQIHQGQQAVIIYAAVYLIPMIILWAISIAYSFSESFRKYIERSISIVKIILSAIFISIGVGLMSTYYMM